MHDERDSSVKDNCPFCDYAGPSDIIMMSSDSIVIEPLEPCVDGHLLVIPKRHVEFLWEDLDMSAVIMRDVACVMLSVGYHGRCNVIINDGAVAGQTIKHLHVHLVPRREGDDVQMPWSWQGK